MRYAVRAAVVSAVVLVATALGVLPASAHVTVHSQDATGGGYAELMFRVPTERNDASTTGLQVNFPADQPLASVAVKPKPGWSFTVTHKKLDKPITTDDGSVSTVVSAVTWKATGGGIAPGEYDDFAVSAGPLPKSGTMTFPAIQTYSNGSVVRWIEVAADGAPQPEHPAPSLQIGPTGTPTNTMAGMQHDDAKSSRPAAQTASVAIAVTALVVALVAVGLGVIALRRPGGQS